MTGGDYLAKEAQPAPRGYPHRSESSGTADEPSSMAADPAGEWPPPGWFKERPGGRAAGPAARAGRAEPRPGRAAWRDRLARVPWPWWLLWPWAIGWAAVWIPQPGQSWHFFAQGGQLLLSAGPGTRFQLYAAHPDLQIGPLALVVSAMTQLLGSRPGEIVALTAMSLTGPLVLAGVWRLLPGAERTRRYRLLFAGLAFLPVWSELTTHFGHLDDLLALCLSVAGMHAVARRHPVLAGLAIAAAADAKPWAAAFVPLLLALPRRQWLPALAAFSGGLAVAWLPFLIADPQTLTVVHFTIPNDPSSALRALGVMTPRTPWWDRSAQLTLGAAGGCLAVRRGRWQAVPLVAMSARILLDPGVYAYYTSGVLLGTIMVDLVLARWRVPWVTMAGAALLYAARSTHVLIPFTLHELGVLRLVFAMGAPLAILAVPAWWIARRPGRHARNPADGTYSVLLPVAPADGAAGGSRAIPGSGAAGPPVLAGSPLSGSFNGPAHSWPSGGWDQEEPWPPAGLWAPAGPTPAAGAGTSADSWPPPPAVSWPGAGAAPQAVSWPPGGSWPPVADRRGRLANTVGRGSARPAE